MRRFSTLALTLVATLFCAAQTPQPLTITLHNGDGKDVGTATFTQTTEGLKLELSMHDFQPGKHGFHIHEKPICDGKEDFDTAGLRFDPTHEFYGDEHNHHKRTGPSAGDPGELIEIGPDGKGHGAYVFPKINMGSDDHSVLRGDGTAIVFHSADNQDGPTRIACGVIQRPR